MGWYENRGQAVLYAERKVISELSPNNSTIIYLGIIITKCVQICDCDNHSLESMSSRCIRETSWSACGGNDGVQKYCKSD